MATPGFDPTLKDLVECGPADWPVLVKLPRAPTRIVDADIATISGAGDKVLQVETAPPYMLHLEFLVGHDAAAQPRKLHKRNLLLEDRHDLDVKTVLVVLREEDDSPVLTGERQRTFRDEKAPYQVFRYDVLRVWQVPAAVLLASGPGTLPLTPLSAVTEADLPGIIKEMGHRLRSRPLAPLAPKLWAATYILMGVRYPEALTQELLRGVQAMKESVTYQAILREGRAEGRAEGTVDGIRRTLLLQGEAAFGPADADTRAALERITNLARLEALSVRLLKAASWQDLLGAPRRRRTGRSTNR